MKKTVLTHIFPYTDYHWYASSLTMIKFLAFRLKLVVEPSGALGLAGLIKLADERPELVRGRRVGVVLSGGNVDPDLYAGWLSA